MKTKWRLVSFILLIFCSSIQLRAQLSDTNSVESIKAKAENGNADAQYKLARFYANGYGVKQDNAEAARWLRKAADQGNVVAQVVLGTWYLKGRGVSNNPAEAEKWVSKAAERGLINAQTMLAGMYEDGDGVPQDYKQAIKWYRRAAQQGDAGALSSLGLFYSSGKGVPKNNVEAYRWFNLAAAQNPNQLDFDAIKHMSKERETLREIIKCSANARDELSRTMTAEEIAEAQRLSAAYSPRKEMSGSYSNSDLPGVADSPTATATGFFITEDGYLITNNHVVKDATKVRLVTSAGTIDAKVVQVDAANDLALLKASGRFAPLPIAASRTVNLGGTVATVGFPNIGLQGFAPKLAKGEIASLSGAGDDPRYFQISVPVQPGNSGGALVDERGNVIGIVSAKLNAAAALASSGSLPENVNYAVKSSFLMGFLESVPAVSSKLKATVTADRKFEDVVKSAEQAAVLVLVY
jgi:S1-C subfamily serine protease